MPRGSSPQARSTVDRPTGPQDDARVLRSTDTPVVHEPDVLGCLGRGLSNAAIVDELVISEATAKTHVSRVLAKRGPRSRTQAALAAQDAGPVP
ncbi:MAG: LuxR family transcriptional regulator [Pseudonocardiaceae bacterium]|nr:MAG: LuxR family transcriptional regulator [Pseudonocardiaceae bacterium]